jgi:hypothetical protein
MSTPDNNSKNTNAFYAQAAISFGVALLLAEHDPFRSVS